MKIVIQKKIPIRRKVYAYLLDQVLNGRIPPNQVLTETGIAAEIGVSRTPVREALHTLENEKLLKLMPSTGYVVKPISEEESFRLLIHFTGKLFFNRAIISWRGRRGVGRRCRNTTRGGDAD
jgi:DNA-binding GntR family transcriptional regulator